MFDSNHHVNHKLSVVSTLRHRISTLVTHEEDRVFEENRLIETLKTCKYPQWALEERKKKQKKLVEANSEEEDGGWVKIPYVKSVSEKIAQVLGRFNITTIHIPKNKIKNLVCNMKDTVHPLDKVGAIYDITFKARQNKYVGETKRQAKKRGCEHGAITTEQSRISHSLQIAPEDGYEEDAEETGRRSKRLKEKAKVDYKTLNEGEKLPNRGTGPVADFMEKHRIPKSDVTIRVIRTETDKYKRGVLEAIEIKRQKPDLNQDPGRHWLSPIYDNILL